MANTTGFTLSDVAVLRDLTEEIASSVQHGGASSIPTPRPVVAARGHVLSLLNEYVLPLPLVDQAGEEIDGGTEVPGPAAVVGGDPVGGGVEAAPVPGSFPNPFGDTETDL